MSRVLIIGSHSPLTREIGDALTAANLPMEYAAGHANALQCLRTRAFGVVITSAYNAVEEGLSFLEEIRSIRPGSPAVIASIRRSMRAWMRSA